MKQEKLFNILIEGLNEMYQHTTPKANFSEELMHRKDDYFLSYTIEENKYKEIIETLLKKYKIKGYLKRQFEVEFALGPSPKISSHI